MTLVGMDNTKKCHTMQKYQKSHQSKDMTTLKIFCDTCWWALTFYSAPACSTQPACLTGFPKICYPARLIWTARLIGTWEYSQQIKSTISIKAKYVFIYLLIWFWQYRHSVLEWIWTKSHFLGVFSATCTQLIDTNTFINFQEIVCLRKYKFNLKGGFIFFGWGKGRLCLGTHIVSYFLIQGDLQ